MRIWKKSYTLRRYKQQKVKKGHATVSYEDTVVNLNVQPLSNTELMVLPEGDRSVKRIKAFGDFPIYTADQKTGRPSDKLFFEGSWYECVMSVFWEHTPLSHYRSEFVIVAEPGKSESLPSSPTEGGDNE